MMNVDLCHRISTQRLNIITNVATTYCKTASHFAVDETSRCLHHLRLLGRLRGLSVFPTIFGHLRPEDDGNTERPHRERSNYPFCNKW